MAQAVIGKVGVSVWVRCRAGTSLSNKYESANKSRLCTAQGIKFEIIEVPGHTLDHIAFYSEENNILFCGDTLFAGGCGRVFEGTFDQMFESLNKLKKLPNITQIYCGHEYTKNNLQFSIEVESENNDLIKILQ